MVGACTSTPETSTVPTTTTTTGPSDTTTVATTVPDASGVITLWHGWTESEAVGLNTVLTAFRSANPDIRIESEAIPIAELQVRFAEARRQGAGPELVMGPSDWAAEWLEAGVIQDLTASIAPEFLATLHPGAVSMVTIGDRLVGLPETLRGVVLFRNRTLVTAEAATFPELIGAEGVSLERGAYFSLGHLQAACGGSFIGPDGQPAFAGPAGVCWLELLRSFPGDPNAYYSDADDDAFRQGVAPYLVDGTWSIGSLVDAIGADVLVIDRWPNVGSGRLAGVLQTEAIYVTAGVEGPDLASSVAFITHLVSVEAQIQLATVGRIPVVAGLEPDGLIGQAARALAGAVPLHRIGGCYWGPLDNAIQTVVSQGADPLEALQTAQAQVTAEVLALRCR